MLLLAVVGLTYELILALEGGLYRVVPVGEMWFTLHAGSLNAAQAVVQRYLFPWLWEPVIASVLQWPAWSLLGGPGVMLLSLDVQSEVDAC